MPERFNNAVEANVYVVTGLLVYSWLRASALHMTS